MNWSTSYPVCFGMANVPRVVRLGLVVHVPIVPGMDRPLHLVMLHMPKTEPYGGQALLLRSC